MHRHEQMCMFQLTVHLFNINVTIRCADDMNEAREMKKNNQQQQHTVTHIILFVLCTMFRCDDLLTRLLIARFSRE